MRNRRRLLTALATLLVLHALEGSAGPKVGVAAAAPVDDHPLSKVRGVFQSRFGDVEFAFLPDVAPITAQHIFTLLSLGAYTGNHWFRVDRGFVAQVADCDSGRNIPLSAAQRAEAAKTVPLEVDPSVRHVEGVLSMGRFSDPNSGKSSFSFLLGAAPHLDNQYTIFGRVTKGMEVLHKMEGVETRKEGIFVMPKERITILASYWYIEGTPLTLNTLANSQLLASSVAAAAGSPSSAGPCGALQAQHDSLQSRFTWCTQELERVRAKCLPG